MRFYDSLESKFHYNFFASIALAFLLKELPAKIFHFPKRDLKEM